MFEISFENAKSKTILVFPWIWKKNYMPYNNKKPRKQLMSNISSKAKLLLRKRKKMTWKTKIEQ